MSMYIRRWKNVQTQNNESNSSPEMAVVVYIKVHTRISQTPKNITCINMQIKYTSDNIRVEAEKGKSHPDICNESPEGSRGTALLFL
jgi:hypothetical protein